MRPPLMAAAPPPIARRRRGWARPISLLVTPLLLALSASPIPASALPNVPLSECAPQFRVNGFLVSGCTTRDSPAAGLPYCVLATPRQGSNLGLCQTESMPQRSALAPDGTQLQCDPWTSLPQQGLVYGCFINEAAVGGQLMCNAGRRGLQPCLKADGSSQPELAIAPGKGSKRGLSTTVIALISTGAGLLLVALALLAYYLVRRRRARAEIFAVAGLLDPPEGKGGGKAGEKRANGRGGATRQDPRESSQYAADSPLSDDGMDSPTNEPQSPVGTFLIKSSYTPTLADEIVVYPGDTVKVFQEFDDGWCSAVNLSRGFTRGVLPISCIDRTSGWVDD